MRNPLFMCRIFLLHQTRRHIGRLALLACLALLTASASARAQTSVQVLDPRLLLQDASLLVLEPDTPSYNLQGKLRLLPPSGTVGASDLPYGRVVQMVDQNALGVGTLLQERNLRFTGTGVPQWMILRIANRTSSTAWALSIGQSTQKTGFIKNLLIVEKESKRSVFNSFRKKTSVTPAQTSFDITLPANQVSTILLQVEDIAGQATILPIQLEERAYHTVIEQKDSLLNYARTSGLQDILLAVSLTFLVLLILYRHVSYLWMALGNLVLLGFATANQRFLFWPWENMAGLLAPFTFLALTLALFETARATIADDHQRNHPFLRWGIPLVFTIIEAGAAALSINGVDNIVIHVLTVAPLMVAAITYGMTSIRQPYGFIRWEGRDPSPWLPQARGCQTFAAISIFLATLMFLILQSDVGPAGFSYQFMILTLLTAGYGAIAVSALLSAPGEIIPDTESDERAPIANTGRRDTDLSTLKAAKEETENRRLVQVLEQERALMSQMRDEEVRRTEEMRRAKEAADDANRAKSAFLAVVSHEIRTPMTGIMGMVKLLMDTTLSRDQRDFAATIQDSGEAMMALLNDILDFEKIESGKMELELMEFDLHRLLRGVYTLMSGHAAAKDVGLTLDVADNIPQIVVGDPTRLRQILLNLVGNAVKFTSRGTVRIQIQNITPEDAAPDRREDLLYFAVQDQGIGMSTEVRRKLFQPFAQADSSISRRYGGTGLGLAICKRLIEAMGGEINVNSKEGEGTTFFFSLSMTRGDGTGQQIMQASYTPSTPAPQPLPEEPKEPPKPAIRHKILIVDDNGISQKVVRGFVESLGHDAITLSSGEQVMEQWDRLDVDLILLDIELGGINGMETTRLIRRHANEAKRQTPIAAMTGNTSREDIRECYAAGMDDFLPKPVRHEDVKFIIGKIETGMWENPGPHFVTDLDENADRRAPILEMVNRINDSEAEAGTPVAFELTDDDLEEDSFAAAAAIMNKVEVQGNPDSLDYNILSSFEKNLGLEQTMALFESFHDKADELIEAIIANHAERNRAELAARSHELKGMAGNFGFKSLSVSAGAIERTAKSDDFDIPEDIGAQELRVLYEQGKKTLALWHDTRVKTKAPTKAS